MAAFSPSNVSWSPSSNSLTSRALFQAFRLHMNCSVENSCIQAWPQFWFIPSDTKISNYIQHISRKATSRLLGMQVSRLLTYHGNYIEANVSLGIPALPMARAGAWECGNALMRYQAYSTYRCTIPRWPPEESINQLDALRISRATSDFTDKSDRS